MNESSFISQASAVVGWHLTAPEMCVKRKKKGGAMAADTVYTNAPTQPQFAQASGLCIAREKRNTHGVRTNG